ncbi:Uncharacterised protein [Salmonella enterica subsp. enterica]|nr:Uncharacterised protein [Salmonella enterica subsp. enterica]
MLVVLVSTHKLRLLVFVLGNRVFVLQRQPNAVQTVQHAVAAEVVDFKAIGFIACFHHLCFQIHFKMNPRIGFHQSKQLIDLCVAQGYRQQLVIETVAVEDVAKLGAITTLKP